MQELYFEKPILNVINFWTEKFKRIIKNLIDSTDKVNCFEDFMKQRWLMLLLIIKLFPVAVALYCLYPQYLRICMTESVTEIETAVKFTLLYFGLAVSQLQLMLQSHRLLLKLMFTILICWVLKSSSLFFSQLSLPAQDLFIVVNCLLSCTKIVEQWKNLTQILEQKLLVEQEKSDTTDDEVKQSILEPLSPRKPKVRWICSVLPLNGI